VPIGANPLREPETFNYLILGGPGGLKNPGIFKLLDGGGRPYKWMINDPPGMQGAYVFYRGWKLSDNIKLQFLFWLPEQIDLYYEQYDPLLSYDARKLNPKPIVCYHPVLQYSGINSIFIKEKGPLKDIGDGKQLWSVTHDACEFRKPPRLNVTSEAEEPNVRRPVPQTAIQRENAELAKTAGIAIPGINAPIED
jgi:hypothetical protein